MQGRLSSQLGREGAHKPHWELLPATMLDHSYMLALKPVPSRSWDGVYG